MRHPKRVLLLACFSLLLALPAIGKEEWVRQFQKDIQSKESDVRYRAVKRIDPNTKEGLKYIYFVLKGGDRRLPLTWYERGAAIDVLAGVSDEDLMEDLKRDLTRRSTHPLVKEGIAIAFGKKGDPELVDTLISSLTDKDPMVRRSSAIALRHCKDKKAIPALIEAWRDEKYFDVWIHMKETLEILTGKYFGLDIDDWENWWSGAMDDFEIGQEASAEEIAEAEKKGKKAKERTTVVRGVELNFKEVGKGPPLFVLPEYGYSRKYMESHLTSLADVVRVFFIDLPPINKFQNVQKGVAGIPYYPIDKLCDAFDELRKKYHQERVAILGHGISGWVAMRYAVRYPKHCSHLVLVSTPSGNRAWGKGRDAVEREGKNRKIPEMEHYAQNLLVQQNGQSVYEPKDQAEALALQRMAFTLYFSDPRDTLIKLFWEGKPDLRRRMGQVLVPEFDVNKEKRTPVPTMIMYGKNALWTQPQDQRQIKKHFPNSEIVKFPRSRRVPFIEENGRFTKAVKDFFRKYDY